MGAGGEGLGTAPGWTWPTDALQMASSACAPGGCCRANPWAPGAAGELGSSEAGQSQVGSGAGVGRCHVCSASLDLEQMSRR